MHAYYFANAYAFNSRSASCQKSFVIWPMVPSHGWRWRPSTLSLRARKPAKRRRQRSRLSDMDIFTIFIHRIQSISCAHDAFIVFHNTGTTVIKFTSKLKEYIYTRTQRDDCNYDIVLVKRFYHSCL